jgi:hypothetical protein
MFRTTFNLTFLLQDYFLQNLFYFYFISKMSKETEDSNISLKGLQNITLTKPEEKSTHSPSTHEHVFSIFSFKCQPSQGPRTFSNHQKEECWNRV